GDSDDRTIHEGMLPGGRESGDNRLLRLQSNDLIAQLAVSKDQEGGDAADPEARRGARTLIDVELTDNPFAARLTGDLIDRWPEHLAGAAPLRPCIDQHRPIPGARQNLIECRIGAFHW